MSTERAFSVYLPFALGSFYQIEQGKYDGTGRLIRIEALTEAQAVFRAFKLLKDEVLAGKIPGVRYVDYAKVRIRIGKRKKPYYCAALSRDLVVFFKLASEKQQAFAWDQYCQENDLGERRVDTWAHISVEPLSPFVPRPKEQLRVFSRS